MMNSNIEVTTQYEKNIILTMLRKIIKTLNL